MSFKHFLIEEEELEKDQKDALDALDAINSKDEEEIIDSDVDSEELEDIEDILDADEPINENVIKKKALDIYKSRYKQKGRLFILKRMEGIKEGENGTISPRTIALFKLMFEYMPKLGRFGKWKVRGNKSEYIKKHKMVDEVRKIKKKKKRLKILKRRGDVKGKSKRGKKIAQAKTGGKTIDLKGKIE